MRKGEPSSQKTGRVKASKPKLEGERTFSSTANGESAINLSESSMRKNLTKDLDPGLVVQAHFPDKQPAYPLTIFYWTEEKAKAWYKGSYSEQWENIELPAFSMRQIWRTFLDENPLFVKNLSDTGFSEEEKYTKFLKAIEGESYTDGLFLYSFDSSFFENLFRKELGKILFSKTIIAAEDACKNPTVFEALTRIFGDSNVLKFDEKKIAKQKQEEVDKRVKLKKYEGEERAKFYEKVELGTTPPGIPILELSENEFSFVDINLGSSHSCNLIVKNGGGGSLEATIKTTKPWLNISHAKIHQKDLPFTVTVTIDTLKDKKCNFGFRDRGYIDISYKKAGSVELVRIPVDLSIQTHRERAQKLTNRAVVISIIASGIAVFYVLAAQQFSGWGAFGLIVAEVFGIAALNQIRKHNTGKAIGWLAATAFLLLLVKEVLFLVLIPIVITWLLSSVIFKRHPMKTSLSFIIPSAACGTCFLIAYFSLSSVTFKKIGSPLISSFQKSETAPKATREVGKPLPKRITEVKINTEEEEFYEVLKKPDLSGYLNFIKKYPSSIRMGEIKDRVISANPNLPPEKYWLNIKKNNKGYWEHKYKDFITLVWIPPGSLEITDENSGQQQEVYIGGFWMGKYEVSVKQFKTYCYENNLALPDISYLDGEPMRNLDWFGANNFCKWIGCRLPTELEWERAAKGGKNYSNYPWGENFNSNFCNLNSNNVMKIGSLKENEFGLYDIIGNVEEWCENWYSKGILSPQENQLYKVLRGGSYLDAPQVANIKRRNYIFPSYKKETYGLRVARVTPIQQSSVEPVVSKRYKLQIASSPSGAKVFIDGLEKGITPFTPELLEGRYKIRIEKEGYKTREVELDITLDLFKNYNLEAISSLQETAVPKSEPDITAGEVLSMDQVDVPPKVVKKVNPIIYPRVVKEAGIAGAVIVQVLISENGDVVQARVIKVIKSPFKLDEAVVEAVRKWKFSPAEKGGVKVKVWWTFRVEIKNR